VALGDSRAHHRDMAQKLFPLPVDEIFSHPDWVALPAAGRGMFFSIVEHFWRTGCRPLPVCRDQLFCIARAHRPTWKSHKARILKLFEDVRPGLEDYYQRKVETCRVRRAAAIRGGQATAMRRRQREAQNLPARSLPDLMRTPPPEALPLSLSVARPGRQPRVGRPRWMG
jgi:hypothetical protein